jgi:hypothetical protein
MFLDKGVLVLHLFHFLEQAMSDTYYEVPDVLVKNDHD